MSSARRDGLLLVLRADAADACWSPTGGAAEADWRSLHLPLAAGGSLAEIKHALLDPRRGPGAAPRRRLTVLLASPWGAAVALPWSDEWLDADSARRQARAELQARGFAAEADDAYALDQRPPLGQPRTLSWAPRALMAELEALAQSLGAELASVQSLAVVAARWLQRRERRAPAGTVSGLIDAGGLQLLAGAGARGLGEALAEAAAGPALAQRAATLWRRARVRFPVLAAAAGLRLLALDEAPPSAESTAVDGVEFLPWPVGAASRSALDRALWHEALSAPGLELRPAAAGSGAGQRSAAAAWTLVALAGLGAAAALAWSALAQQDQTRQLLQMAHQADTAAAPPLAQPPSAAEAAELRAVDAAVRQLNLQLPALLRSLRPPRDIVVTLLALDLVGRETAAPAGAAEAGAVKLVAQAGSSQDMTRYLGYLAGRRGVASAQLLRHEIEAAPAGAGFYRFEVDLQWQR
ncbi:conserved hypothetical protein [Rubrivivax sp. A210]|uniref:hypothetical protein n=1 Tax=Rubrivivax sp. A210 TaxID=2772301 RepID=UPI00191A8FDF|nr:hypothetical protein [Rubrivivax sp. A210]CAD5372848.1 conserved hypothetical protein [Rubrivivax sp. A210]